MKRPLCALLLLVLTASLLAADVTINDAVLRDLSTLEPEAATERLQSFSPDEGVAYGVALFQLWLRDGKGEAAELILERTRAIAADAGMHQQEAELTATRAMLLQRRGHVREAMELVRRSIAAYEEAGVVRARLTMMMFLGNLQHRYGALSAALQTMEELLQYRREMDDELFYADTLTEAAMLRYKTGRLDGLTDALEEALTIYREHEQDNGIGTVYRIYGNYYNAQRNPRVALEYYERARERYVRTNNVHDYANISFNIGIVYVSLGAAEDAVGYFENAIENFAAAGSFAGAGMAGTELGRALFNLNRFDEARMIVNQAKRHLEGSQSFRRLAQAHTIYAAIRYAQGNREEAIDAYREALAIYRELGLEEDARQVLELINRVRDGSHRGLGI